MEDYEKLAEQTEKLVSQVEVEGRSGVIVYFNLLHQKLFALNSLLVGGGIALFVWNQNKMVLVCVVLSFIVLVIVYVDYRMMVYSRDNANIRENYTEELINGINKYQALTNLISFGTILLSLFLLIMFIIVSISNV